MVIGLSGVQLGLCITSMITDQTIRYEILLPVNHKNYNFREKTNGQVMKEREHLH